MCKRNQELAVALEELIWSLDGMELAARPGDVSRTLNAIGCDFPAVAREISDEGLVLSIRRRFHHEEAFEELVARYESQLLRCFFQWSGHRQDAEDLVQEVWGRLFLKGLKSFDSKRFFRPWLFSVAYHLYVGYFRSQRRQRMVARLPDWDTLAGNSPTPLDEVIGLENYGRVEAILKTLPEKQQFVLRESMAGATPGEIAEALECKPSVVYQLLFKARREVERSSGGDFQRQEAPQGSDREPLEPLEGLS